MPNDLDYEDIIVNLSKVLSSVFMHVSIVVAVYLAVGYLDKKSIRETATYLEINRTICETGLKK